MIEWLRENYEKRSTAENAKLFEQEFDIEINANSLINLNKRTLKLKAPRKKPEFQKFTPEMIEWVKENYHLRSWGENQVLMRERFGVSISKSSLLRLREKYGLERRPPGGRFEKGHVPKNKGVKIDRDSDAYRKMSRTFFKKGNDSNVRFKELDVAVRFHRKSGCWFKWIKVGGRFRQLNRYIWESAHGPIPGGHVIKHIDGDTTNCDSENLRCISRRVLARLNHHCAQKFIADCGSENARISLAELDSLTSGKNSKQ